MAKRMFTALALAALIAQPPSFATGPDEVTSLDEIVVIGVRRDLLVSVQIDGDLDDQSMVVSAPAGVRCGGHEWRWADYGRPRGCWIRRTTGETVMLEASDDQPFDIAWTGCEVQSDPHRCRVFVGGEPVTVTARFTRRG